MFYKVNYKLKKSISVVVEYMLLTFVVVLIIFQILNLSEGLIKKFKMKNEEKIFLDLCEDFNFYIKNLNYKGFYYFPIKVEFKDNYMIFKNNRCFIKEKICNSKVYKEVVVIKGSNEICFKKS